MHRRTFLASVPAAVGCLAGCGGSGSGDPGGTTGADPSTTGAGSPTTGTDTRTTTHDLTATVPEYLHQSTECDPEGGMADGKTVFTLGAGRDEPRSYSATVEYASLSPAARSVVDFVLAHGRAETCESGVEPVREVVDAVHETMSEAGGRPDRVYVEKAGTYYEVGLGVDDQVFYEP